jgi:hypothetical protein
VGAHLQIDFEAVGVVHVLGAVVLGGSDNGESKSQNSCSKGRCRVAMDPMLRKINNPCIRTESRGAHPRHQHRAVGALYCD